MVYLQESATLFLGKAKEILSRLNWVDVIGIIVVIRTFYIGIRRGLLIEIFKIAGFGVGLFIALTQYRSWSEVISEKSILPIREAEVLTFLVIFALGYGITSLVRFILMKAATFKIPGGWDRIGGGLLGFGRGCLWLIFLEVTALCLSPMAGYLSQSIRERSFFGPSLLSGGKVTYQVANRFSSRFTSEKVEAILQENYPPSSQQKK